MAHFAKLDENLNVIGMVWVEDDVCTVDGKFSEQKGIEFLTNHDLENHKFWAWGCKNGTFRANPIEKGGYFDNGNQVFVGKKIFPSWILDKNFHWTPPITKPDGNYVWNETKQSWVVGETEPQSPFEIEQAKNAEEEKEEE